MVKTLTGIFASSAKIRNVREDLIASGLDREKFYVDEENHQVKVMVPSSAEPEIMEILKRHDPNRVDVH